MWLLTHAFAVVLMLAMSALAAIAVLIAHAMAVDRRPPSPAPVDDAVDMLRRWDEEARTAGLQRQPDGGEGRG